MGCAGDAERVPAGPAALRIPMRYLLPALSSGCLFLLCHGLSSPSFLFALQLIAGPHWYSGRLGFEQTFICVPWRPGRQRAVFGHLSRAASPETSWPSERGFCATCHHRGFSPKALRCPWLFQAAAGRCALDQECGHLLSLHLSQQLIRQNRISWIFFLLEV